MKKRSKYNRKHSLKTDRYHKDFQMKDTSNKRKINKILIINKDIIQSQKN